MPKTFLWKLSFIFWFSFFLVNIPIQILGINYIKDLLKSSEEEKISLMLHAMKPVIALNISFKQEEQLKNIFATIVTYDSIDSVELTLNDKKHLHFRSKDIHTEQERFLFETTVLDPFDKSTIATIKLRYYNAYLNSLNNEFLVIFPPLFLSFTMIFYIFFIFFIRKDLDALSTIASRLSEYLHLKTFKPIEPKNLSREIMTIVTAVNNVTKENERYVKVLEVFNNELESKVTQKVQELKKQEELMIHQSRQAAMGEMIESIAHQWRQPLNIIGLATTQIDLAYTFNNLDPKVFQESMDIISYNIDYMSTTIDDFRGFIQPNQEMLCFAPQKSFKELLKILGAQLKDNSIDYDISIKDELKIMGIENEFKQVALIIVNNSIDAIQSKKKNNPDEKYSIRVIISQEKDNAIIEVIDNGGGIDASIINSIFTAYFSTKFSTQGTGIGLYIVKNIIESRMHGTIEAKNIQDGCCFRISLPIQNNPKEILL